MSTLSPSLSPSRSRPGVSMASDLADYDDEFDVEGS
jgi:hypothetical protein